MSRRLLWGMVILLIITNITTVMGFMKYADEQQESQANDDYGTEDLDQNQVAIVGNSSISRPEWIQELTDQFGRRVLENMIDQNVVFQLADRYDIKLNEKWVNREVSILETTMNTFDEKQIEAERKKFKENVLYQLYLEELLTKDIVIEEQQIKQYYEKHKDYFDFSTTYQLSHILLEDMEEANQVLQELEEGASFSMLAREYSIDSYTKDEGGYLGYFAEDNVYLPSAYYETAKQLSPGEYSDSFQTKDGSVILYLHRVLPEITFTFEELKPVIKRRLAIEQINVEQAKHILWDEVGVEWMYSQP